MATDIDLIWVSGEEVFFLQMGLDRGLNKQPR
jgi:hypothetical protein